MSSAQSESSKKRRAHRKSRTGCHECKRRRIKCHEERPKCTHCVRHDVPCVYPVISSGALRASPNIPVLNEDFPSSQASPQPPEPQPYSHGITFPPSRASDSSQPSEAYFELKDLALLHHWTLETSKSILQTPQLDHFWQSVFPSIGFQNAYVIHSILSIAALHTTYLQPTNRHISLGDAVQHHTLALQGLRQEVTAITPHNSDAIFASATLAFFFAFLTFGELFDGFDQDTSAVARTSRVLGAEWIPLVRGLQVTVAHARENVVSGPLRSLLDIGNWFELELVAEDLQLSQLKDIWSSSQDAQVYDETLSLLRRASAWMQQFQHNASSELSDMGYNRDWSGPFIWLSLAPAKYFELQSQRQPPALILFAHFGALLQRLDDYWWMQGCGKSIVQVVDDCLGPYWNSWTAWPKQVVGLK